MLRKLGNLMKNPKVQKVEKIVERLMPMFVIAIMGAFVFSNCCVYADAKDLMNNVIKIIGSIATVLGVGYAAIGIFHFAAANADGDGPAKNKAIQQIAAGAILLVVGGSFIGGASWLTNEINTSFNFGK